MKPVTPKQMKIATLTAFSLLLTGAGWPKLKSPVEISAVEFGIEAVNPLVWSIFISCWGWSSSVTAVTSLSHLASFAMGQLSCRWICSEWFAWFDQRITPGIHFAVHAVESRKQTAVLKELRKLLQILEPIFFSSDILCTKLWRSLPVGRSSQTNVRVVLALYTQRRSCHSKRAAGAHSVKMTWQTTGLFSSAQSNFHCDSFWSSDHCFGPKGQRKERRQKAKKSSPDCLIRLNSEVHAHKQRPKRNNFFSSLFVHQKNSELLLACSFAELQRSRGQTGELDLLSIFEDSILFWNHPTTFWSGSIVQNIKGDFHQSKM